MDTPPEKPKRNESQTEMTKKAAAIQEAAIRWLRFGIPSLDRLFYQKGKTNHAGLNLRPESQRNENNGDQPPNAMDEPPGHNGKPPLDQHVSLCIQGPSGTGKSVLGLHLASRYWADSLQWGWERTALADRKLKAPFRSPRVLYLSTDLGIKRARSTWESFSLETPNKRELPFNEMGGQENPDWKVQLQDFKQQDINKLAKYLNESTDRPDSGKIAFLDLAESTAGDDWGFITRVISLLPPPGEADPHHLLVIDAIEGLEMLTGDTDAFGQIRSRRSRIAQILRAAAGKCHVVLILEEDSAHQHPAEEYVADIVIRLRVSKEENYYRRSLEVVKARGQTHIRGEHDYVIRQGVKSDDGSKKAVVVPGPASAPEPNQEPWLVFPDDPKLNSSYVHVLHSLHSLSRILMYDDQNKGPGQRPVSGLALMPTPRFGAILPPETVAGHYHKDDNVHQHTYSGLHRGRVTSLMGDEATLKSRLGRAFLAGAFAPQFIHRKDPADAEAAVLITTFNTSHHDIKHKLICHWNKLRKTPEILGEKDSAWEQAEQNMDTLFICRQLEVHHLNGSHLFHIIRRCVERALLRLAEHRNTNATDKEKGAKTLETEKKRGWSEFSELAKDVRVVIDDWALIQSTHPEIAADKLFLPFLIKYFQRVGVTALIISTQPGRPEEILRGTPDQPLRALTDYRLYTWHVPFYGSDRVALTALPPMRKDLPPTVGELRNPTAEEVPAEEGLHHGQSERLWLDNHFELYKGVENNDPQPVPLEVHLFSGADGFAEFTPQMGGILNRLFTPREGGQVLVPENHAQYAELRDFLTFHGNIHYDHAMVIQLDEYWKQKEPRHAKDKSRDDRATKYLKQKTYDISNTTKAAPVHDPFLLYQPPVNRPTEKCQYQKFEFFDPDGYGAHWYEKVVGIPYQWDFGFLLLKKNVWEAALLMKIPPDQKELIEHVYENLKVHDHPDDPLKLNDPLKLKSGRLPVTWHAFFKACVQVSLFHNHPGSETLCPFDLDTRGPQSFASLILEIWASEIHITFPGLLKKAFPPHRHDDDDNYDYETNDIGLYEMLGQNQDGNNYLGYRFALFRSWMLLAEVLDAKSLTTDVTRLAARPAPHTSVAERQWYSTGSLVWKQLGPNHPVIPARLPGSGAVRGDWFLMVGKDSRSQRLSERAIDLLSRRRRNQDRMELGLGLPIRRLNDDAWNPELKPAKAYKELLTAMATYKPAGRRRFVRYGELLDLGSNDQDFQWFWRSRLKGYHNDDRVWEKWLGRILVESCKRTSLLRTEHHISPFAAYERVKEHFKSMDSNNTLKHLAQCNSSGADLIDVGKENLTGNPVERAINAAWKKFNIRCDSLASELR